MKLTKTNSNKSIIKPKLSKPVKVYKEKEKESVLKIFDDDGESETIIEIIDDDSMNDESTDYMMDHNTFNNREKKKKKQKKNLK